MKRVSARENVLAYECTESRQLKPTTLDVLDWLRPQVLFIKRIIFLNLTFLNGDRVCS